MASNTDTIPVESGTATRETTRPPKGRPPSRTPRAALSWAAVVAAGTAVVALAVATFAGGDDNLDIPATRLDPRAEQYERDAHLEGQARTYGRDNAAPAPSETGNRTAQQAEASRYVESLESRAERAATARTVAEAERIERQAHLEGQARTYGQRRADTSETPAIAADAPEPEFLPGSRHVPTR
jgi:hypothetical protein